MCVLPDHEIVERLRSGSLVITDYSPESLTPNGYDLRVAEVSVPSASSIERDRTATVPPGAMFYVSTVERVELPSDLAGQLWLRTSWMRKGVLAGLGKVDAGFKGTLTFMAVNLSREELMLPIGSRFVQLVFETLHSPASLTYEKRSGNYQGQNGVTLAPIKQADVQGEDAHRR
ncbi:MAG: dCTP deaminase [Methanomassiliicoccaceae archaeon]|jgi:dCTP deaminase|nr:dCTP deaminase [Euryarchaeota archaeon]HOL07494.1 dCTP deaminase [Methanomassiliicoccaceae archaeon]HOQ26700.1 dCTP deaminase [Methanomassiliicoccaceae archaeon]HQA21219.1 dCTP deaminase [Methanomassiliicoccaceae archaeon]